jgi:hypothetical protein
MTDERTVVERMVAALGGWEKASRRVSRRMKLPHHDEQTWVLHCMLCGGTSREFNPKDVTDAPSLVSHDRECFISIARHVLCGGGDTP